MSNRFKEFHAANKSKIEITDEEISKMTNTAGNAGSDHSKVEWGTPQKQVSKDVETEEKVENIEKERTIQLDAERARKNYEKTDVESEN